MKTALEQANDKIAITPLTIKEAVRVKLKAKQDMIKNSIYKLEAELTRARLEAKACISDIDNLLYVSAHGGWIIVSQHNAEEITSEFTSIDELILDNVPFRAHQSMHGNIIKQGDVIYKVSENGMLTFNKAIWDTSD